MGPSTLMPLTSALNLLPSPLPEALEPLGPPTLLRKSLPLSSPTPMVTRRLLPSARVRPVSPLLINMKVVASSQLLETLSASEQQSTLAQQFLRLWLPPGSLRRTG